MLDRFNGDVLPFGSSATGTERTIFGDVTQSDDINANINADYFRGWGIIGVNDVPTKQDFNAMAYTNSYLTSYLYQQGIPTWNTNQKYYLYSRCIGSDGKQYKAKTGTLATPNVGNDPVGDSINWEEDSSELDINSLTNKTTPVNTDNLVIQETGGVLKKLSWSNLKANIPTLGAGTGLQESSGNLNFYPYSLTTATTELTTSDYVVVSDGTVPKKITIANFTNEIGASGVGIGQTWQDVLASRSAGVTYTNTTGKPIQLAITTLTGGYISIDGSQVQWSDSAAWSQHNLIIPNGSTYSVQAGLVIYKWWELR